MCKLHRNLRFAKLRLRGPLAQLAEQLTLNQQVQSSSLWRLTSKLSKQLTWLKSQSWGKSESNQLTKQNKKLWADRSER